MSEARQRTVWRLISMVGVVLLVAYLLMVASGSRAAYKLRRVQGLHTSTVDTGQQPSDATDKISRPNVIIFLADDVGYRECGFQGNLQIPTPHIDSIARNGVRFTQAYNAALYCGPSRAALMTGRYPTRFGFEFNGGIKRAGLPVEERTIADRLKPLGYSTLCAGKWDLGTQSQYTPTARGFDEFYGTGSSSPFFHPLYFTDSRKSLATVKKFDDSFYTTEAYAERAVQWIGEHKDSPFFLYMPFNAAHLPLQAPQKYVDRFPQIANENRRLFAAVMSAMDDAVGAVLAALERIGQEENTLIFFLSDNGGLEESMNFPLRGIKGMTLEGGIRVPHCLQWKRRIQPGITFEAPILNLDLLPTIVAAAGGTVDAGWKLDGVDLMPYLTGKRPGQPHEVLYWRMGDQWAIRKRDWKLCDSSHRLEKRAKLYNLAEDISEKKDLTWERPDIVEELHADWHQWNAEQLEPLWPQGKPSPQ